MASSYTVRTANVVQLKNTLAIHDGTRCGRGTHSILKKLDSEVKDVETKILSTISWTTHNRMTY